MYSSTYDSKTRAKPSANALMHVRPVESGRKLHGGKGKKLNVPRRLPRNVRRMLWRYLSSPRFVSPNYSILSYAFHSRPIVSKSFLPRHVYHVFRSFPSVLFHLTDILAVAETPYMSTTPFVVVSNSCRGSIFFLCTRC